MYFFQNLISLNIIQLRTDDKTIRFRFSMWISSLKKCKITFQDFFADFFSSVENWLCGFFRLLANPLLMTEKSFLFNNVELTGKKFYVKLVEFLRWSLRGGGGSISSTCLHTAFSCANALVLNFYLINNAMLKTSCITLSLKYTQLFYARNLCRTPKRVA